MILNKKFFKKESYKFEVISNKSEKKEITICGIGEDRDVLKLTNK